MIAIVALAAALAAHGPADRVRLDSLADETARSITRFADRRVAIAEGYRRIGTDFPSMGEHWVHPAELLGGSISARRPTILVYATVGGRSALLGAGFIATTTGEAAADVPGWPSYWHEHSGLLADESGAHASARAGGAGATHVWVLHVWTALANPTSRYDADNWALPFARLSLAPPPGLDHDVGRAASLAVADGDGYLRGILSTAGFRSPGDAAAVDAAIADATGAARGVIDAARARGGFTATDADALRAAWETTRVRLRSLVGPGVDPLLAPARAHTHAHDADATPPLPASSAPPPTRR